MLTALQIMHIVGYVHRDVSAGNILFWKGTGILSDLESAKKTTDLSIHEVRTVRLMSRHVLPFTTHNKGTNQYESVEVREKQYLFMERIYLGEDDEDDETNKNNKIKISKNDNENNGSCPPFKFNCIHDLESAWWIAFFSMFL
jgi:hypothetical protein